MTDASQQAVSARLADRTQSLERSKIRVMFGLAEQEDRDLVRLEVGEPDFGTPDHIIDAAAEAARGARPSTPRTRASRRSARPSPRRWPEKVASSTRPSKSR